MNNKVIDISAYTFEKKAKCEGYRIRKDQNRKIKVMIKMAGEERESS